MNVPHVRGLRLLAWPWTLGAVVVGFLLVVVAPPLELVLLVAFGALAFRESRRANGNSFPLAVVIGLALIVCVTFGLLLAQR